jgi:thiamine biosynthesis lipoprotein
MPGVAGSHDTAEGVIEIGGAAFGTTWRALVPAGVATARLMQDIGWLLRSLDATMSPFRNDSELARLNAADGRVEMSRPLADVVNEGLRIAHLTDGAFDPSVGSAVARFGFGPIWASAVTKRPDDDYRGFEVAGQTVVKRSPTLTFDPCGIGKGYALDRLGEFLATRGVDAFFVEFGGEVLVRGHHPLARPWWVAIEDPKPGRSQLRHVISMTGGALATSGDRHNAYMVGGRRYSHIIDPRSAAPVDNGVASVSVMAPTAMTADALATALMVMGPVRGIALAEREALPVLFVLRDGDRYRDIATAAFRANIIA